MQTSVRVRASWGRELSWASPPGTPPGSHTEDVRKTSSLSEPWHGEGKSNCCATYPEPFPQQNPHLQKKELHLNTILKPYLTWGKEFLPIQTPQVFLSHLRLRRAGAEIPYSQRIKFRENRLEKPQPRNGVGGKEGKYLPLGKGQEPLWRPQPRDIGSLWASDWDLNWRPSPSSYHCTSRVQYNTSGLQLKSQRSNCQHPLDHQKSKRVPEKHLLLLYSLCQSLWLCGSQQTVESSSRDPITCLLRNLYAGQEAIVRTGHGTTYWFQIGKGVHQHSILSPCLFNYAEYIMWNAGLDETQPCIKIARKNINNFRYTDDTILTAEIKEEQKILLMKVKKKEWKKLA